MPFPHILNGISITVPALTRFCSLLIAIADIHLPSHLKLPPIGDSQVEVPHNALRAFEFAIKGDRNNGGFGASAAAV
jgi:hypothetical protein